MDSTEIRKEESEAFYKEALVLLNESGVPYMVGGGFALCHYTGLYRDSKDLDIFVRSVDYPKILKLFAAKGFRPELHDVRWIVKIFKDDYFIDVIFNSVNNICTVDDVWLERASQGEFFGVKAKVVPAEELIWCKSYIWNRERFDGADINHMLLMYGNKLDWKLLLNRLDLHWHLLLAHIVLFQFVYPSDFHQIIPKWLFDELIARANEQYDLPPNAERVCRGPMIDNTQYCLDVKQLNYLSYTIKTT
jgi:hypothetical protein